MVAAVTAIGATAGTVWAARRTSSGDIVHTPAVRLWDAQENLRKSLTDMAERLTGENERLRSDLTAATGRIAQLEAELAVAQARIVSLERGQ